MGTTFDISCPELLCRQDHMADEVSRSLLPPRRSSLLQSPENFFLASLLSLAHTLFLPSICPGGYECKQPCLAEHSARMTFHSRRRDKLANSFSQRKDTTVLAVKLEQVHTFPPYASKVHVPPLAVHDAALREFDIVSFNSAGTSNVNSGLCGCLQTSDCSFSTQRLSSVKGRGPSVEIKQKQKQNIWNKIKLWSFLTTHLCLFFSFMELVCRLILKYLK